ncbi:DUF4294 domain-containing protein [Flavihumibacter sp. UBA7668]|uniref:DUF4294 domain-containing protein n=1 Tax=Flavihumibacter sp. UBA7668 TaxID=1946542 RepID=UPI0025C2581B|nr:DUF4294 domain-containing protein [Flavihumibacter sp. UBA7668]
MMKAPHMVVKVLLLAGVVLLGLMANGQTTEPSPLQPRPPAPVPGPLPFNPKWGPNDTIIVPIFVIEGDTLPSGWLQYVYVTAPMPPAMRKRYAKWTRLRNAVYVTYPYARKAGIIINDINAKMEGMSKKERRRYLESREEELKKEFSGPLTKLSVYQGRILMKLINRQTGNNCYNLVKEYRGGVSARFWQTVAFFFGSSLKQPYDPADEDKEIELIVQEVERMYR